MRRYALLLWLAWVLPAGLSAAPDNGDRPALAIIVAADAPDLPAEHTRLARIYQRRLTLDRQGKRLVPVNLPAIHVLRRTLTRFLFGKTPQQLTAYWNRRYFEGVSPPYVLDSQEAVLRFVATTAGAVGYVADCRVDQRVRVVERFPLPPDADLEGLCVAPEEPPLSAGSRK